MGPAGLLLPQAPVHLLSGGVRRRVQTVSLLTMGHWLIAVAGVWPGNLPAAADQTQEPQDREQHVHEVRLHHGPPSCSSGLPAVASRPGAGTSKRGGAGAQASNLKNLESLWMSGPR